MLRTRQAGADSGRQMVYGLFAVSYTHLDVYKRQGEGALWDMTDAWENSELKASGRVTGEAVIDNMKIDGQLYGFPVTRGNGCITSVSYTHLCPTGALSVEKEKILASVFEEHGIKRGSGR